ncbi:MAG TPA: Mpo1-like protein [Gemmataceae bacterium]|nr:Mpo1-like protein [Gemmataceae bacterium]
MTDPSPSSPSPPSVPRRPVLRWVRKRLRSWQERHQHPFNFGIHLVGIPLAVAGVVMLFFLDWYWGVGAVVLGYLLQYIGHAVEGNDVGEWALIKRCLGLPYVAVSPRWQKTEPQP